MTHNPLTINELVKSSKAIVVLESPKPLFQDFLGQVWQYVSSEKAQGDALDDDGNPTHYTKIIGKRELSSGEEVVKSFEDKEVAFIG